MLAEALSLEENLDDTMREYRETALTITGDNIISAPADEGEVRGALMTAMIKVNNIAKILAIGAECVGAGSGRALSFTDLVVRKSGQVSNENHLSALILGAGEVKGDWQLNLHVGEQIQDVIRDPMRIDSCVLALQQVNC